MALLTEDVRLALNNLPAFPPKADFELGDTLNSLYALANGSGNPAYEGPGAAVSIHVATTGNDTSGTGASTAPYATVARALADVPVSVERQIFIRVAAGTYGVAFTTSVLALQRFVVNVFAGWVKIVGAAGSLNSTVTLVSENATPGRATERRLDIGANSLAITAGETFVVQAVDTAAEAWYPVIAMASPNVDVIAAAGSFTPGESLVVRNLGVTFADTHMQGLDVGAATLQVCGVKMVGGLNWLNTMNFNGCTLTLDVIENIVLFGCFIDGTNCSIKGECSLDRIKVLAALPLIVADGRLVLSNVEHEVALGSASAVKFRILKARINTSGTGLFSGLGIAFSIQGCQLDYRMTTAVSTLSQILVCSDNSYCSISTGTATGTCTGIAMTVSTQSTVVGAEAAWGAVVSTPAGSDVTVGANAATTWALLPSDDLAAAAGTRQLCRAT